MITEISVNMTCQKRSCHGVTCKGAVRNFGKEEFLALSNQGRLCRRGSLKIALA